jgi:hypothetical protein
MEQNKITKWQILKTIYPSIVTYEADWRSMLKEVNKFNLKEISLFLTGTDAKERKQIYNALEKSVVTNIPHVHARDDMVEWEYDYLIQRFKTKAFTLHFKYIDKVLGFKCRKKIFIENNSGESAIGDYRKVARVGGLAIDLSHLAGFKTAYPRDYLIPFKAIRQFSNVGCNHVSNAERLEEHRVYNVEEFNYLAKIPKKFFSKFICIELTNSIKEQLIFKDYIAELLSKTWTKKY